MSDVKDLSLLESRQDWIDYRNDVMKMPTHEKLRGIPHIRYINLDERPKRDKLLKEQFSKHGITDYKRISASKYSAEELRTNWYDHVCTPQRHNLRYTSILVNQLHSIMDWYNEEVSETCLIIEDDLSFDNVANWTYDWSVLMDYIPRNWECVQLHILGLKYMKMHMHQRTNNNQGATCYMINRKYAKKLIDLHWSVRPEDGNRLRFLNNAGHGRCYEFPEYYTNSPDFVPYEIGLTYSIPLFTTNKELKYLSDAHHSHINKHALVADKVVTEWWKNEAPKYQYNDILTIDSQKSNELIFKIGDGQESW